MKYISLKNVGTQICLWFLSYARRLRIYNPETSRGSNMSIYTGERMSSLRTNNKRLKMMWSINISQKIWTARDDEAGKPRIVVEVVSKPKAQEEESIFTICVHVGLSNFPNRLRNRMGLSQHLHWHCPHSPEFQNDHGHPLNHIFSHHDGRDLAQYIKQIAHPRKELG